MVDGLGFLGADHVEELGLLCSDFIEQDGQFFTVGFIDQPEDCIIDVDKVLIIFFFQFVKGQGSIHVLELF